MDVGKNAIYHETTDVEQETSHSSVRRFHFAQGYVFNFSQLRRRMDQMRRSHPEVCVTFLSSHRRNLFTFHLMFMVYIL